MFPTIKTIYRVSQKNITLGEGRSCPKGSFILGHLVYNLRNVMNKYKYKYMNKVKAV